MHPTTQPTKNHTFSISPAPHRTVLPERVFLVWIVLSLIAAELVPAQSAPALSAPAQFEYSKSPQGPLQHFVHAHVTQTDWDDEEVPEYLPGLIGEFETSLGRFQRVDSDVLFAGERSLQDPRLQDDKFTVTWSGWLYAKDNGDFRISAFVQGAVDVRINDSQVLSVQTQQGGWHHSLPIPLSFGRQAVEIKYTPLANQPTQVALYWSGPSFGLEPIAARHWSHDNTEKTFNAFETGRRLSRGLRCDACHQDPSENKPPLLDAPALTHLQGNLRPSWLVAHLQAAAPESPTDFRRRMPYFELDRNSAMAISAALFSASKESNAPPNYQAVLQDQNAKRRKRDPVIRSDADPTIGATLFASRGCLACHSLGELGMPTTLDQRLFGGGDLAELATKRTPAFVSRWLQDADQINADNRMPQFEWTPTEHIDLVAFLKKQGLEESKNDTQAAGDISRGIGLIEKHRCGACHTLPASLRPSSQMKRASTLGADSNWRDSCLGEPKPAEQVPGYGLTVEHQTALQTYYSHRNQSELAVTGEELLAENNCLACHQRELDKGISAHLPDVAAQFPDTASRLAALSPPAITGVGDKLHASALRDAITRKAPRLRTWLDVQMPRYDFSTEQLQTIADFLVSHDRIPEGLSADDLKPMSATTTESSSASEHATATNQTIDTTSLTNGLSDKAIQLGAARLVTSEGFGCQSCHQIGDFEPPKVDLKARGTNLSLLGERIRPSWFQRWVRNPSRIVPRMEMPAIQVAAKGVLNDNLDLQLSALWETLNDPQFVPPRPNPGRIVRTHNLLGNEEAARLVTCVIETESRNYIRPLAIGLSNRHNFLFDLEAGQLAGWWLGDTAGQYTRGKTWYWELGNQFLNTSGDEPPKPLETLVLLDPQGGRWVPKPQSQLATVLDRVEHIPGGIQWQGRFHFKRLDASDNPQFDSATSQWIAVQQKFTAQGNASAVESRLAVPSGWTLMIETFGPASLNASGATIEHQGVGHAMVRGVSADLEISDSQIHLVAGEADTVWETVYHSELPADVFPRVEIPEPVIPPKPLDCVPGYEVVRLPLPPTEMPVSFAFDKLGRFFTGSLKGNVSQLHDDDGDGLHERIEKISDEYPTPFGMQVTPDGDLDVLTKFALIRLTEHDLSLDLAPDAKWSASVIADGWGYTADYHDWAIGLEKDDQGNYWMALPCQQDDRSEAAAYLRGHAVKLVPIKDSSESQRAFRPQSFAAGLRFPIGIARSPDGDLFTSDNQGNYNPFNELNHLREGKRYGFINKLENRDGFSPPFESPAINIPHPWTRSVNGICWLYTPDDVRAATKTDHFGSFEGHLLGCEMNGRALIRMSLQKVGDTFQGACYNFSLPGLDAAETFVGPIVCEVAPNGDIYVGSLQDSGWGGGQNTGSIARLRPTPSLPVGIAEVTATHFGFEIEFTQPVERRKATQPDNYQMRSYRRVSTPAYGGDDQEERTERPAKISISDDNRIVTLTMDDLREDAVYEINVGAIGQAGETLFPAQAHYTMRAIPEARATPQE